MARLASNRRPSPNVLRGCIALKNNAIWPLVQPGTPTQIFIDPSEEKEQYSLQAHWKSQLSIRDSLELRVSNDKIQRESDFWEWETSNADAELLWARQLEKGQIHLGLNYRWTLSHFQPGPLQETIITPARDNIELYSTFAQFQYELTDNLELTLGAKYESHSNAGDNVQPSVRAIWAPSENQRVWLAASKAIATPSRAIMENSRINIVTLNSDQLPPEVSAALTTAGLGGLPVNISAENRGEDIDSTELTAYELGYRFQWNDKINLELAVFNNDYNNLISTRFLLPTVEFNPAPYVNASVQYTDEGAAEANGVELNTTWKITPNWLIEYTGSYINFNSKLAADLGFETLNRVSITEDTPTRKHSIRSYHSLSENVDLNIWLYHYGEMKASDIDDFTSASLRLEWRPNRNLSLALQWKNLLDSDRSEFFREIFFGGVFEVETVINVEAQWSFD